MPSDFWVHVMLCGSGAAVMGPSSWVRFCHLQEVQRLHRRCLQAGEALLATWKAGNRDGAKEHLKQIHTIETEVRRWISPGCRAILILWALLFSTFALVALQQLTRLPETGLEQTLWSSPYTLGVLVGLAALYSLRDLFALEGLPTDVGALGRKWADAMTQVLEEENARRRQAQSDAETSARSAQGAGAQSGAEKRFWEEYHQRKQAEVVAAAELEAKTILGLQGKFTMEDLDHARRRLVKKLHPDLVATRDKRTRKKREDKLKRVNAAYDVLKPRVLN